MKTVPDPLNVGAGARELYAIQQVPSIVLTVSASESVSSRVHRQYRCFGYAYRMANIFQICRVPS